MLRQFIKFGMVGIIGFFVDSYALYGFMDFLGLDLYVGRLASYLVAATATWALNRIFTFQSSKGNYSNKRKQWGKFLLVNSIGGFVNYGVYAFLVSIYAVFTSFPVLAIAVGSISGLFFNFFLSRKIVFQNAH
jgi:putative flippase GtrA